MSLQKFPSFSEVKHQIPPHLDAKSSGPGMSDWLQTIVMGCTWGPASPYWFTNSEASILRSHLYKWWPRQPPTHWFHKEWPWKSNKETEAAHMGFFFPNCHGASWSISTQITESCAVMVHSLHRISSHLNENSKPLPTFRQQLKHECLRRCFKQFIYLR